MSVSENWQLSVSKLQLSADLTQITLMTFVTCMVPEQCCCGPVQPLIFPVRFSPTELAPSWPELDFGNANSSNLS